MTERILRDALAEIGQKDRFEECWHVLEEEWLTDIADLKYTASDPQAWQSLRLPLRLKVELSSRLLSSPSNIPTEKSSTHYDPSQDFSSSTKAVTKGAVESKQDSDIDGAWETFWDDEYQCYYYFNSITGDSQWVTDEDYLQSSDQWNYSEESSSRRFHRPRVLSPNGNASPLKEPEKPKLRGSRGPGGKRTSNSKHSGSISRSGSEFDSRWERRTDDSSDSEGPVSETVVVTSRVSSRGAPKLARPTLSTTQSTVTPTTSSTKGKTISASNKDTSSSNQSYSTLPSKTVESTVKNSTNPSNNVYTQQIRDEDYHVPKYEEKSKLSYRNPGQTTSIHTDVFDERRNAKLNDDMGIFSPRECYPDDDVDHEALEYDDGYNEQLQHQQEYNSRYTQSGSRYTSYEKRLDSSSYHEQLEEFHKNSRLMGDDGSTNSSSPVFVSRRNQNRSVRNNDMYSAGYSHGNSSQTASPQEFMASDKKSTVRTMSPIGAQEEFTFNTDYLMEMAVGPIDDDPFDSGMEEAISVAAEAELEEQNLTIEPIVVIGESIPPVINENPTAPPIRQFLPEDERLEEIVSSLQTLEVKKPTGNVPKKKKFKNPFSIFSSKKST